MYSVEALRLCFGASGPAWRPCGAVFESADDAAAVRYFWDELYYGTPTALRPCRNVKLRRQDGVVLLDLWPLPDGGAA